MAGGGGGYCKITCNWGKWFIKGLYIATYAKDPPSSFPSCYWLIFLCTMIWFMKICINEIDNQFMIINLHNLW